MPTTLNDITNAASYRGDIALGGGGGLALDLDTRPIQQLNQYTFLYNKSQYDQRQKDADQKIRKIGELAPYDLINGIEKDATELKDAQAKLTNYLAEYAAKGTPKSPKEKIQQELDLQKNISGQLKLINSANARRIKLDTYTNAVQANNKLSAQEKELRISQAKQLFNDTDINTLPDIPDHDLTLPQNSAPIIETVNVLKTGLDGNAAIKETIKQFSIGNNWKTSYLDAHNLAIPTLSANATPQQKAEYEQKKLAFAKTGLGAWQSATDFYNSALVDPNYKKTLTIGEINVTGELPNTQLTAEVDVEKVKQSNPIVGGIISLAERYNEYATKRLEDIKNGFYIDTVTGEKVLLTGGDKASDVKFIDVTKPLKPEELSFLDKFEKAAPDQIDKTIIETDDAIQRGQLSNQIKLEKMQQAGQNYRATLENKKTGSGGGNTTGETRNFMDLTGYTGALTTADIAAIDPTLVVSESGVLKLNANGAKATFKILPNGDVEVNYNDGKPATDKKAATNATIKVINKGKYQKESVAITQTILKDRKGEEGNPFTFTGIPPQAVVDVTYDVQGKSMTKKELNDLGYTDAQIEEAIKLKTIKKK